MHNFIRYTIIHNLASKSKKIPSKLENKDKTVAFVRQLRTIFVPFPFSSCFRHLQPIFFVLYFRKVLIPKGGSSMKQETKKRIHYIYSIALSVMLVVCGILLMIACSRIYLAGGDQPYTPETVAAAFKPISVPVYICLGMILVSILLQLILWQPADKQAKGRQPGMQLRRLRLTRDPRQADEEKQASLKKPLGGRRALIWVCAGLSFLAAAVFGFFALVNLSFFPEAAQATAYVVSLMPIFAPCATLALGYGVLTAYLVRRNTEKQIAIFKQCPPLPQPKNTEKPVAVIVARCCLVALALALIVVGLVNGGWQDVLTKAVNICTECVGLG